MYIEKDTLTKESARFIVSHERVVSGPPPLPVFSRGSTFVIWKCHHEVSA